MSLREAMPITAAFIDDLREAYGAEKINAVLKKGMAGLPNHFYATENDHEAGTPFAKFEGYPANVVKPTKAKNDR